jgi:ssDNA-binding replication factor A large subunit
VNAFLSAVQTIVEEILAKRHDLNQEEVLALIEQKKEEGRGLLSDEGAARLVAEELLIRTRGKELGRMQVRDLVSGLNDVTISGRILLAWPPQSFQRRDGTPGRVMNLILVDRTGRVRCALWDRHADTASKGGNLQGKIIRIGHAYTRQGMAGDPEVNAGDRSSIELDPPDIPHLDFPEFEELFIPLGKITPEISPVNAVGVVEADARLYSFAKEDRQGSVLRTALADASGSIQVVAWNERAEELREIKKGDILQIVNARTKLDNNSKTELHVETRSQATLLPNPPPYLKMPVPRIYKIADLTAQDVSVDLSLTVIAKNAPRQIKRATGGEDLNVSSLLVADETGIASLSLWDDKAELANQLNEEDTINARGVSVRERLGELRLGLGKSGELQKSSGEPISPSITKLNVLAAARGLLIVEGSIADEPLIRQVVTEKGETVNVASFTLRDDAGSTKVTLWRDQAIAATKLRPGTRLKLIGLRARSGLNGQLELSSIPLTKIEMRDKAASDRPAWEDIRQVISLEPGVTTWIKGLILEVFNPKLSAICETCGKALRISEGNFTCDECKSTKTGNVTMEGLLRIDDGTGVTEVLLPNQDPRQFMPVDALEFRERMLKEGKTVLDLEKEALTNLVGKEIEAYGTAEAGTAPKKLLFKANRIITLNTP